MPDKTEAIALTAVDPAAFDPHMFAHADLWIVARASRDSFGQTLSSMARRARRPLFLFQSAEEWESVSLTPRATVQLLDPAATYGQEVKSRVDKIPDRISEFDDRMEELEEHAQLEGHLINAASKDSFLEFFKRNPLIRRDRLVLMENGNLRAVWKGEDSAHIGLQFLNKCCVQYVLFKQREPFSPVSRAYGRDTMKGIMKQIKAFNLENILLE